MTRRLPKPWIRPETGIYYLRVVVPKHLAPFNKKKEVKQSLRTKDAVEAAKRFRTAYHQLQLKWAALCETQVEISELEARKRGKYFKKKFFENYLPNPSRHNWNVLVGDMLDDPPSQFQAKFNSLTASGIPQFVLLDLERHRLVALCSQMVGEYLASKGLKTDNVSRSSLVKAAGYNIHLAAIDLDKLAENYFAEAKNRSPKKDGVDKDRRPRDEE